MKALTLWQPWASLVAQGGKRVETRGWSTTYRGPLLIHAAARTPDHFYPPAFDEEAIQVLGIADYRTLPRGKVLAVAQLVGVQQLTSGQVGKVGCPACAQWIGSEHGHRREHLFGDYTVGRFAWILHDVRRLMAPRPARGSQGLWIPPVEMIHALQMPEAYR